MGSSLGIRGSDREWRRHGERERYYSTHILLPDDDDSAKLTYVIITRTVEFRMVVFRPFKTEVIMARITDQNPQGIFRSFFPYSPLFSSITTTI